MPEKFIWHIGIALHCLPRILLFPATLHKHYRNTQLGQKYNVTTWWFWVLNLVTSISQVVENGALLTLTYISSTDNFGKSLIGLMLIHDIQRTYMYMLQGNVILHVIDTPL